MALIERIQHTVDATHWRGKIPMNYVYTAGRAGELFFKTLRDKGEFVGTRCESCDMVYVPPRMFCERCFQRIEKNVVKVPNRGVVHTFTICHETYDELSKAPSIVALIRFDGAEGGLMHWLGDVKLEQLGIDMPVKAVLKPRSKRTGSILDIDYFKPL